MSPPEVQLFHGLATHPLCEILLMRQPGFNTDSAGQSFLVALDVLGDFLRWNPDTFFCVLVCPCILPVSTDGF